MEQDAGLSAMDPVDGFQDRAQELHVVTPPTFDDERPPRFVAMEYGENMVGKGSRRGFRPIRPNAMAV